MDSGLTPLNSYENVSINFRTKIVDVLSSNFIARTLDSRSNPRRTSICVAAGKDEVPVAAPVAFNGQTLLNHQDFISLFFQASVVASSKLII